MSPDELKRLLEKPLVVLDTETTGFFYASGDEIIELAAEKVIDGNVVETFHRFIRPIGPISWESTEVHGLTEEFIHENGLWAEEVFPSFTNFISGAVLVGHNIRRFDYPFIATHYIKLGLQVPKNELIDTLELSRAHLKLPNHKLGTIASHFSISTEGAHRAMADVVMTRQILLKLLSIAIVG